MNIELEARRLEEWDNTPDVLELLDVVSNGDILEIGTGTGKIIEELSKYLADAKFTGIDIEEYFIRIARKKRIPNADFIVANAFNRVLDSESYDYVIFRDSLHQIQNHEGPQGVIKSIENAFYYLRNRGKIVIRDAIKSEPIKIEVKLDPYYLTLFYKFLENKLDNTDWTLKGDILKIDAADLTSFLGNWRKIEMDKDIKIRKSKHYSISEYNDILNEIGFKCEEIRRYRYSSHLIPNGVEINQDNLPETYAMFVYNKKVSK